MSGPGASDLPVRDHSVLLFLRAEAGAVTRAGVNREYCKPGNTAVQRSIVKAGAVTPLQSSSRRLSLTLRARLSARLRGAASALALA